MVESAPFPLVVIRIADQSVLYINQLASELFGVIPERAVGRTVSNYLGEPEERLKILKAVKQNGRVLDLELQLKDANGRFLWALLSANQMRWLDEPVIMVAINDISARKLMEEELHRLATTDSLTGILNRRQFLAMGEQELRKVCRYHGPLSLIIYDVDHFKKVNDTYGHQTGDKVLKEITRAVSLQLRNSDIFGRVGGEEFGIILPETAVSEALHVAERIRFSIENLEIAISDRTLKITASFGVAGQLEDYSLDTIYNRADDALYQAKEYGRNTVKWK